jgi:hypothetical protein
MSYQNKILSYINELRKNDSSLSGFVSILLKNSELVLIGGAVRDILSSKKPRDLDFVYWGELSPIISKLNLKAQHNRFGGYKLSFRDIDIDIWSDTNNWAFKEHFLTSAIENVHEGCFYNYDSLVCALNEKYFENDHYRNFLKCKKLDFILKNEFIIWSNPFPALNIVRAIQIKVMHNIEFSDYVDDYIHSFVSKNNGEIMQLLRKAELKHYKKLILNTGIYKEVIDRYL